MSAEKAGYPQRPDKKGRPKSTHRGSKKSRVWFEKAVPNVDPKAKAVTEKQMALAGFKAGHSPSFLRSFLSKYQANKVEVKYHDGKGMVTAHI